MEDTWNQEPNDYQFDHLGYTCVAHRQQLLKHWLGFVVVDTSHPWFGAPPEELLLDVHGGIVTADYCPLTPDPRQDEWWIGFECNRPFDLVPFDWETEGSIYPDLFRNHVYRDLDFVIGELKKLAKYAKQVANQLSPTV